MQLSSGHYVITDPCYLIRDEDWNREFLPYCQDAKAGLDIDIGGKRYCIFSTAFGDGRYCVTDQDAPEAVLGYFDVDSGNFCFAEYNEDLFDDRRMVSFIVPEGVGKCDLELVSIGHVRFGIWEIDTDWRNTNPSDTKD